MPGRILLGFRRSTGPASSSSASIKSRESDDHSHSSEQFERNSMEHLKEAKRHSIGLHLPGSSSGSSKSKKAIASSPRIEAEKPIGLSILTESPPLTLHGNVQNSTGALFSGQLHLDVKEASATLEKFEVRFLCTSTARKAVVPGCRDCTHRTTELKKWDFLNGPLKLAHGRHSFPMSYLLSGDLPATTHGNLGVIEYHLDAEAVLSTGETVSFQKIVEVKRAIIPGNDKHSVRIFPPTNLTAHCTLPSVIHPIGEFGLEMRLAGITTHQADSTTRWRLRKLVWRIEEHQKMISSACPKHLGKVGGEGKGIQHEDTRIIGQKEIKDGWKSNFDDGSIEVEFRAGVNPALKPVCNVEAAAAGLNVTHAFVVEMVVAEEWVPKKRPTQATPTGAARVLRTQFNLTLTDRGGLGIAWDEEQPPVYEDVPASPPTYADTEVGQLQELAEDAAQFHLN